MENTFSDAVCIQLMKCHATTAISFQRRDPKYVYNKLALNYSVLGFTKRACKVENDIAPHNQDVISPLGNPRETEIYTENGRAWVECASVCACAAPLPLWVEGHKIRGTIGDWGRSVSEGTSRRDGKPHIYVHSAY